MGLLPLNYRRPGYVDKIIFQQETSSAEVVGDSDDASSQSQPDVLPAGIPDALAFDTIMNGGTCPPCTIRDFMNYLVYIEHAAENLQFFLWYRDYTKRFSEAPSSETVLAPEWTRAMEEETAAKIKKETSGQAGKRANGSQATAAVMNDMFKGTGFEMKIRVTEARLADNTASIFGTPRVSSSADSDMVPSTSAMTMASCTSQTRDAFHMAGVKQPFTIQPFREEITRMIATYIVDGAERQLNLSDRERQEAMWALSYTTHPSALRTLSRVIENTLRRQAHPNFIRWTICNGNPARVTFARGLGVGSIMVAAVGSVILTLSSAGRGWRALFAILWVFGIATLITAIKGMCVVLHGLHHRHVRPWELFVDIDDSYDDRGISSGGSTMSTETLCENGKTKRIKNSFDSFGPGNSYEDEPWVVKYERRLYLRRVFDRQVWIQEPALRQIQDTIFLQSILAALLGAGILTAIFVAVPAGGLF